MTSGKTVFVAGAGIGGTAFGLALLQLCKDRNIHPLPNVHVFEGDLSPEARSGQGYFFTLKHQSGGMPVCCSYAIHMLLC